MKDGLLLVVTARINGHPVCALIDSGSSGQISGHVSGIRKQSKIFVTRICTRSPYSYNRIDSESWPHCHISASRRGPGAGDELATAGLPCN